MLGILNKVVGSPRERTAKKLQPLVNKINALEDEVKNLTREQMVRRTEELRERVNEGESLESLLPEAFALVREASARTINIRHFDVQLMGGIVLHQGNVAEMMTGEGKTFAAPLAAYLNALVGEGVHVVTVNDYLSHRDAQWVGKVYDYLGLSVGCLQHESAFIFDEAWEGDLEMLRPVPRKEAYQADITYGTNNEFGFDYLRDNMARDVLEKVQRNLYYAIVDEADNILIDEARTPLIISGAAEQDTSAYYRFAQLVKSLEENRDYTVELKHKAVNLTDEGITRVEKLLHIPSGESLYDPKYYEYTHYLDNALKAKSLFHLDQEYTVQNGEVIIVDEFTGRLMYGRRYSEGLHQAIEAKEGIKVERESQTLATITIQNYFRMYEKLAGMTGTAATESEEFGKIYNMDVVEIPTNRPMVRKDFPDRIFKKERSKFEAVADEVAELYKEHRPVLVGTTSIEKSEVLSDLLKRRGIRHQVLNARYHEKEAAIVAEAGQPGAVTIATNMAGRGTDIVLGPGVADMGGLHIIGTERHEARRIDNQLRGRAGRQGDPGSSRFYVSLEDELMRRFGIDRVSGVMGRLGVDDNTPIEASFITKQIESAQAKAEGYNFDIRKHVVEYDAVMNQQRDVIYVMRDKILANEDTKDRVLDMVEHELEAYVDEHLTGDDPAEWDYEGLLRAAATVFPVPANVTSESFAGLNHEQAKDFLIELAVEAYDSKEREMGEEDSRLLERLVLLNSIDTQWVEYLTNIEELREGIGLRAFGQRDPLVEFKSESFRMFEELMAGIEHDVATTIYKVAIAREVPEPPVEMGTNRDDSPEPPSTPKRHASKVGRNDPCPCGSGKKFKYCHGAVKG